MNKEIVIKLKDDIIEFKAFKKGPDGQLEAYYVKPAVRSFTKDENGEIKEDINALEPTMKIKLDDWISALEGCQDIDNNIIKSFKNGLRERLMPVLKALFEEVS